MSRPKDRRDVEYPAFKVGQVVKFDSNRRDVAGIVTKIEREFDKLPILKPPAQRTR